MRCYHRVINSAKLLDSEVLGDDFWLLSENLMGCDPFYDLNRHIDWYQVSIGSDIVLEQSRRRLLYLLDSYGDNLYQEDNFKRALADTSMEDLDYKEDFNDFYVMSRLFLVDILEGWADDDKSLRKMLFVSTYYDLTGDKRVERIIHKYQETEIGKKVLGAILDRNYAAFDFSGDSEKMMIKTNQDDVQGKKDNG